MQGQQTDFAVGIKHPIVTVAIAILHISACGESTFCQGGWICKQQNGCCESEKAVMSLLVERKLVLLRDRG